jgi:hypothetical protein
VLIGNADPSASSSVTFTNLKASTRYRMALNLYGSSTGIYLRVRFREGSTDKATSYYIGSFSAGHTGATGNYLNGSNNTHMEIGRLIAGVDSLFSGTFDLSIAQSQNSAYINGTAFVDYDALVNVFAGRNDQMATCDGITIYPSTGTFTGNIKLYEYK